MSTILIVEDELNVRENLRYLFAAEKFTVLTAKNGKEGYEKATEFVPDIILSDVCMPDLDGLQLLQLLQSQKETAQIPFLFLTAKVEMDDLRKGMNLGADDYIIKPYDGRELLNIVKLRLRKKESSYESTNAFKEQLITRVPHELRTPLVGIIGFSELLENESDYLQPGDIKKMAGAINKSGKRLHKRIEKFLQYSELVAMSNDDIANVKNRDNHFELDGAALTRELEEYVKEVEREEDTKIFFEDCTLKIYERFYKTIVYELFENSIKFSGKGSKIIIKGFVDGSFYRTMIYDSGVGMDKKSLKEISSFKQFSQNVYAQEGVGIGLAFIKKVLQMFDGHINIAGEENQSTQIEFWIPLIKNEIE